MRHGVLLLTALLAACTLQPPPRHPRPALTPPTDVLERYAIPGRVRVEVEIDVGFEPKDRIYRGRLLCGDERVDYHLLLPDREDPAPLVILLPILAGGEQLLWLLGEDLRGRGFAVAWTRRVATPLRPGQRGPQLEDLFRRTIVHNRIVLHWLRDHEAIDGERTGLVGVSMGGMLGSVMLAVEPDILAGAMCLAGADLPDILVASAERRVREWRDWREREDGLGPGQLRAELRRYLLSEPAHLAPYVETGRALIVATSLDDVVPMHQQDLLWESLGRPQRLVLPLGHYTAALALGAILDAVGEFLVDRLGSPRPNRK